LAQLLGQLGVFLIWVLALQERLALEQRTLQVWREYL
jgi:hypothetical protein